MSETESSLKPEEEDKKTDKAKWDRRHNAELVAEHMWRPQWTVLSWRDGGLLAFFIIEDVSAGHQVIMLCYYVSAGHHVIMLWKAFR